MKDCWIPPQRETKAMQYVCNGYTMSLEELINGALFESQNEEMVIVRDIEQCSLCEHPMQPFIGKAHGAYIPTRRVLGEDSPSGRWLASYHSLNLAASNRKAV